MRDLEFSDSSVVRLRPCTFVRETADRFGIIRRRGESRVVVRQSGLEAGRLLRRGCSIGETKLRLAQRFQVAGENIDLGPLLRSLAKADLIASVDGKRIPERRAPSLRSAYRYYLRFHVAPRALATAYTRLPITPGKSLAYWVQRLDAHGSLWPRALAAEERYRQCPGEPVKPPSPGRFAERYFSHLVRNIVDFQALVSRPPADAEQWMRNHVEYQGLEHLLRLTREKVPVILAGFHFSATKLVPVLLLRAGFDIAQMWVPDGSADLNAGFEWLDAYRKFLPQFGRFTLISDFTLAGYRKVVESLRARQVLVWFPDMFASEEPLDEQQKVRRAEMAGVFGIRELRTDFAQARMAVPLCGRAVHVYPWVGAFARMAGAAVVPAALVRENGRMRFIVKPALRMPARATAADAELLNRALFAELDSLLRRYPEQWFGWHRLCPAA